MHTVELNVNGSSEELPCWLGHIPKSISFASYILLFILFGSSLGFLFCFVFLEAIVLSFSLQGLFCFYCSSFSKAENARGFRHHIVLLLFSDETYMICSQILKDAFIQYSLM